MYQCSSIKTKNYKTKGFFNTLAGLLFLMFFFGCSHSPVVIHDDNEEEHHDHEDAVVITSDKAQEFGIETIIIEKGPFAEMVKVTGRIEPSVSDVTTIVAKKSGIFMLNPDVTQGMRISSGQIIGSISGAGLEGGDINAAARANMEVAKKELDRLTSLYKEGLVTASVYNEAERAYKEAEALASDTPRNGTVTEVSPVTGVLTLLPVSSGEFVEKGTVLGVVVKSSRLTLRADVPVRFHNRLPTFTDAIFRPEYSDSTFKVSTLRGNLVSPGNIAAENGFIPLYFNFENNGQITPGAFCEIYLKGNPRENVITVPVSSLIEMQGNKYVYVVEDNHAYEKRLVETGSADGKYIEIINGLDENETVVAKGATTVRMVETSAVALPTHNHNH